MNITRGDIIVYSTPINEGSRRVFELMQEDYITLVFKSDKPIYFKVGDNVGDFEITDLVVPDFDEMSNSYNYDIRFDKYYWKWKNKKFFHNPRIGAREASWALTADLPTHLNVVLRNLEYLGYMFNGAPFEFNIDNTVDNKSLLLRFDDLNIIDALTQIAEAYECEWWITDNIINFGRCEYGDAVDFEVGVNVEEMKREASQDTYATRIYAFGSTRNIPRDYRPAVDELLVNSIGEKRLSMPKGVDYIDAYEGMTQEEAIEEIVIFDDVYPSRDNTITDVRVVEGVREDKEKFYTYYIKDNSLTFDEKWVLGTDDKKLQLTFKSGLLNGHTYVLKYHQETNEFEINRNEKDYGEELPNDRLFPKVGDVFNLFGYDTKYVDENLLPEAEKELERRARAYVEKSKIDPSVYRCSMMSDYMTNRTFEVGDRVRLLNKAFFEDGRESRIIGYEYPLDIPYDSPIYIVGETAQYFPLGDLKDKVEELVYKDKIYQSTGAGVYVVGQYDNTEPTDRNVLSSKRSLNSFHRKDKTDSTDYLQKFNKGAEFGQYGKKKGAYINEEGIGDFEKVVSKETDFKEMHSDKAIIDVATINELITKLAKIHKLEVTDTATILKAVVKEYLTSEKFVSGFAGEGFRINQAINGDWNLEIDNLIVRKLFNVFELLVQEIKHQGGMQLYSPAGGKITKVTDGGSYWKCEIESADTFFKDDLVICQKFTGVIKRYWRAVTSVGAGYINLSKNDCETNSAIPEIGDEIAVQGNKTNTSRQSVYIVSVVGADSPYTACYSGINSYSLKDKLVTREGNLNGIIDKDFGQLKGYGLYANNAYLKGILRLTNGKTVEQEILNTNNKVEANRLELGGEIDKAKADAKNAQDSINGLVIGTRNLVQESSLHKYVSEANVSFAQWLPTGKIIYKNVYGTMGSYVDASEIGLSLSDKFAVMSFRYRITDGVVEVFGGHCEALFQNNVVYLDGVKQAKGFHVPFFIPQDNEWHNIDVYFSFKKTDDTKKQLLWIQPNRLSEIDKKGSVEVDNLIIIKGNRPADWTLAPEDQKAELTKQITEVRTDFDVIEGQINMNVAKTEQLVNQTNGLVEETKQTATQVNQTATEINQNVSRAEESANRAETAETNINTKADSIVMEASRQSAEKAIEGLEIGGRNYLLNSGVEKVKKQGSNIYLFTSYQSSINLTDKEEYTLSIDASGFQNDEEKITSKIWVLNNFNEKTGVNLSFDFKNGRGVHSKVFKANEQDAKKFALNIYSSWYGSTNEEKKNNVFIIHSIKLEKGNKATDWTPAPEDIDQQFQATNSKLELLSDQFTVEVTKTDGIRTDLTRVEQGFDDYKIEIVGNINNAIDDNNEVIKSSFEMNGNKIGLLGEEIDLTGKVTFSALDSESQGKINTANDNANTANNAIGQLKTDLGDLAYEDMVSIAKLDNTIIEGGYIKTSLIEANSITADKIDVQSLEAVRIRTGNLEVLDGAMIGGFKVKNNGLTNAGFNNNAYIIMRNDPQNTFVGIGANVFDDFSGFAGNARFEIGTRRSSSDSRKNVALSLLAEGCELRENNIALNIQGGSISGFGLTFKKLDNSIAPLDSYNERWVDFSKIDNGSSIYYNYITSGSALGIKLPYPKDIWIGRYIRFVSFNTKMIFHVASEGANGTPYMLNSRNEEKTRVEVGRGGYADFVNIGGYWHYI